jgi:hypothetical protein
MGEEAHSLGIVISFKRVHVRILTLVARILVTPDTILFYFPEKANSLIWECVKV